MTEDHISATVTDISTRRPVAGTGRPEGGEQRATGARAFVRSAGIRGKACATHPVTRFVLRQGAYVAVGARQSAKRWREARTTVRYDRMLRLAEAAGNQELLADWEDKRARFVKERHARRMAMLAAPYHVAKATVITGGVTVGGLLALGIALAIANKDIHEAVAPRCGGAAATVAADVCSFGRRPRAAVSCARARERGPLPAHPPCAQLAACRRSVGGLQAPGGVVMKKNEWHKSSASNGGTNCIEVRELADGSVELRDTKDRAKSAHRFTPGEWNAFLTGVRAGEFDLSE